MNNNYNVFSEKDMEIILNDHKKVINMNDLKNIIRYSDNLNLLLAFLNNLLSNLHEKKIDAGDAKKLLIEVNKKIRELDNSKTRNAGQEKGMQLTYRSSQIPKSRFNYNDIENKSGMIVPIGLIAINATLTLIMYALLFLTRFTK